MPWGAGDGADAWAPDTIKANAIIATTMAYPMDAQGASTMVIPVADTGPIPPERLGIRVAVVAIGCSIGSIPLVICGWRRRLPGCLTHWPVVASVLGELCRTSVHSIGYRAWLFVKNFWYFSSLKVKASQD